MSAPVQCCGGGLPKQPQINRIELRKWGESQRYFAYYAEPLTRKGKKPLEGLWLSRTTSLLNLISKPALPNWYAEMTAKHFLDHVKPDQIYTREQLDAIAKDALRRAEVERDASASVGTSTHNIQHHLQYGRWPDWLEGYSEAQHAAACWLEWWTAAGLTATDIELTVAHIGLGYAGTLDCLALDREGRSILCDWKTSKKLYPEMLWQVAAYATALQDHGRPLPDVAYIVRLPKDSAERNACHVVAWDEPTRRAQLINGWRTFVRAHEMRPSSVKEISFATGESDDSDAFVLRGDVVPAQ